MEYVIIGGDARFDWLARLLRQRGERVKTMGREGAPAWDAEALSRAWRAVVNFPPKLSGSAMSFEAVLAALPADARLYACGPWHPGADERVVDLWADEVLILKNAQLTAEGALAAAMGALETALTETRCLVIGLGRIGQALTRLLTALGAPVTAASRSEEKRGRAAELGVAAVDTARIAEDLPGHGLVFNTAPGLVLDGNALRRADPSALIVDLASPPYGVDLRAAWENGLRAWREPGLPGRYCPGSAAWALLAAMDRSERRAFDA